MLVISWIVFGFGIAGMFFGTISYKTSGDEKEFSKVLGAGLKLILLGVIGIWLIDWDMILWIL